MIQRPSAAYPYGLQSFRLYIITPEKCPDCSKQIMDHAIRSSPGLCSKAYSVKYSAVLICFPCLTQHYCAFCAAYINTNHIVFHIPISSQAFLARHFSHSMKFTSAGSESTERLTKNVLISNGLNSARMVFSRKWMQISA